MAKIKDVALAAGVSTATVSRVLRNKPHVRAELRQRVQDTIERLDYRPNLVARSLRSQQSNTIGLIVSDIRNPFFTSVSRAVEDSAYREGFSVFLCNTDENPDKEAMYLELMQAENVAGVIFSPTRQTAEEFEALELDIPIVVVDRSINSDEVDSVLIDNVEAGKRLTSHLIENGYRQIGALFGEASTTGRERQRGFVMALKEHGLTPVQMLYTSPKIETGYEGTLQLLDNNPSLDAIFTTNSLLTAGALKAIRERKLRIPDDVALVGFDETTWSSLVEPAITLIAQPTYEIGTTATELLLQRINQPDRAARQVILKTKLLKRASSAPRS